MVRVRVEQRLPEDRWCVGTVTATAADHLTLKTDAGETYQVAVSANTRLNKERQPVKVADIKVGDGVGAMGVLDPATKTVHAVFVTVIDAEQVKKARGESGQDVHHGKSDVDRCGRSEDNGDAAGQCKPGDRCG